MTILNADDTAGTGEGDGAPIEDPLPSLDVLALASIASSGLGFMTLLKLADRSNRTPARALGLFLATSFETITGTALGFMAASRASESRQPGKGMLLGASGAVLGIVTTILKFNWMRTRRRL